MRYVALLCVVYFLILSATAPAALLGWVFTAPTGIAFEQLAGTLWHGSAGKLRIASSAGPIQIRDFKWEVQWRYLLHGEIALTLETAAATGSLSVARDFAGLRIAHADLTLPAADLAQLLPALALWQPGGEVQFQTQGFTPHATGAATIVWRNAALNLTPLKPLGDYRLQLLNTDGKINGQLETQSGTLRLTGAGEYSKQSGLHFSGIAQADAAHAATLQSLLALLGKDRGDGVYVFSLRLP